MTIGIPGSKTRDNYFGIPTTYYEFIEGYLGANDIRILTVGGPLFTDIDLLVLPGGADINPLRYGQVPSFATDEPDIIKEYFDVHMLPRYVAHGTPIFGICRGMQTIAVHFGYRLIQDMYHETNTSNDPYGPVHKIIRTDAPSGKKIDVNSRHHQSVYVPRDDNGVITVLAHHEKITTHVEAIKIKDMPICGVQWHPESCSSRDSIMYAVELAKSILK